MTGPSRRFDPSRAADARRHRAVCRGAGGCARRRARSRVAGGERGHPPDRRVRRPGDGGDRPGADPTCRGHGRQRGPWHRRSGPSCTRCATPGASAALAVGRSQCEPRPSRSCSSCSLPLAHWEGPASSRSRDCPRNKNDHPAPHKPTRPHHPPDTIRAGDAVTLPVRQTDQTARADRHRRADGDARPGTDDAPDEDAEADPNGRTNR